MCVDHFVNFRALYDPLVASTGPQWLQNATNQIMVCTSVRDHSRAKSINKDDRRSGPGPDDSSDQGPTKSSFSQSNGVIVCVILSCG